MTIAEFASVISRLYLGIYLTWKAGIYFLLRMYSRLLKKIMYRCYSRGTDCGGEGIEIHKSFSDKGCNPCAHKIRNLGSPYKLIKGSIEGEPADSNTSYKTTGHYSVSQTLGMTPWR